MHDEFRLITIVRHPVDRFYSMFYYAHFQKVYKIDNSHDPVQEFLRNTPQFYHKVREKHVFECDL